MTRRRGLVLWLILGVVCVPLAVVAQETPSRPAEKAPAAPATKPDTPLALSELDALRLEKLAAERSALQEKFGRLQAEAQRIQAELPAIQQAWAAKGQEIQAATEAAARHSGVAEQDVKTFVQHHTPDVGSKTWR